MENDDPYQAETIQKTMQQLRYEEHLKEQHRQAEDYYFSKHPQHRDARPLVMDEASALLRERPEFNAPNQPPEKLDEAVQTLGQRVNARLAKATAQQSPASEGSRWSNFGVPTDAERQEALDEEVRLFEKRRQPPR